MNRFLSLLLCLFLCGVANAQIVISGFLPNPLGTDARYEYVQLKATQAINFATTPYSVVWTTIGGSTVVTNGWASGGAISYGFNLTSGSVAQGDVFYVGGDAKLLNGAGSADISTQIWIRTINTATTNGDGFGTASAVENMGNGGSHADGLAVFAGLTSAIIATSVPLDAIFYGTSTGNGASGGTNAFQLPLNDRYAGGLIQNCGYLFADPGSGDFIRLTGTFNPATGTWVTKRESSVVPSPTALTAIASTITLGASGGGTSGLSQPNVYQTNTVLATFPNGVKVYDSGYGSALAKVPNQSGYFYLMTDRGPNIDGAAANSKVFPTPTYSPRIGKFRIVNNVLVRDADIIFKDAVGDFLNGLPNAEVADAETAYATNGNIIAPNTLAAPRGIDAEGLAALADGTFWVSDEYGPYLFHFTADGRTLERITPFAANTDGHKLPLVLKSRLKNRGMEGLTLSPDGTKLVGLMQGPLDNPLGANATSLNMRLVVYTLATGATKQYVYVRESTSYGCNAICAINNDEYLVIEKSGDVRIQRISLVGATDISDPADAATGKLYGGQTVEQLTNLTTAGITPVSKSTLFSLTPPTYPHDKAEGITIINSTTIAISNDDDFGISTSGTSASVKNDANCTLDKSTLYFYTLPTPLTGLVTSVATLDKTDESIQIFPTATDHTLTIVAEAGKERTYTVFNLLGQIQLKGSLNGRADLNVSHLATGFYLLNVDNQIAKFFKQ